MNRYEEVLQGECYVWYWNTYRFTDWKRMLHHNNNNSANAIAGARNRTMGVVKGVADLELVIYGTVLFIELKVGRNKQTPEQEEFQEQVEKRGFAYIIIRSLIEFQTLCLQSIGK